MSEKVKVYVVNTQICGGNLCLEHMDDVISTFEAFLIDEDGNERLLTESEKTEITKALTGMKLGDKYFFEDFTVEYKEFDKEEFENLPEFDGC